MYIQPLTELEAKNKRAYCNSVHKEIIKTIDFEKISKHFLDGRINMLIRNHKIMNMLSRNKDSFCIAANDFNSSITYSLLMTQESPSFLSITPSFLLHVTRVLLIKSLKQ